MDLDPGKIAEEVAEQVLKIQITSCPVGAAVG